MHTARTSAPRLRPSLLPILAVLVACLAACEQPSQFLPSGLPGGPQGILDGTVTYLGPPPCTESQHVVGAAVLLVFSTDLLPPPEGLGTTAASLGTVGGDTLFAGVADQLTFNGDGSMWCPPAAAPPMTVSAPWTIGPLGGGVYEVRGFYDYKGTFDPVFSITKLPVQGDIAGGAVENATSVLMGAAPIYRKIALGAKQSDGTYEIPDEGANIGGISVTFALPLPLGLPTFYPASVAYASYACTGTMVHMVTPPPGDPTKITMPADYQIPVFNAGNPMQTAGSLITLDLKAGVPPNEVDAATKPPFDLPVKSPAPTFTFSWQDVNGDGMLDLTHDHAPASTLVPALFPLSIFSMLASPKDDLTAQSSPVVIIQGLTIYKTLVDTVLWSTGPMADGTATDTDVFVGVAPAVLCLDVNDPTSAATLVVTHKTDCSGLPILSNNGGDTIAALKAQFHRPVTLVEACLPQGRFAMNLVYDTGQAWSVPNEAGVCQTGETESSDGASCKGSLATRARLSSQDRVLTIGPPTDPSYCAGMHAVPTACCPNGKCQ